MSRLFVAVFVALLLAGCVTESVNDPLAANKDLKKAHEAYVKMAMVYIQRRDMMQADRAIRKAAAIDDDDAALNNARGLFFTLEDDPSKAEEYFLRAISDDPEFSAAYNNYAALLYRQKRYEDAIDKLEVVVKHYRYEGRFQAFETLGQCHLALKHFQEAAKAFEKALQLNPKMPGSLLGLATLAWERGDLAAAERFLASYESFADPTPEQLWLGIRLQRQLGDKNKLASYELALRKLFPGSPQYSDYQKTPAP